MDSLCMSVEAIHIKCIIKTGGKLCNLFKFERDKQRRRHEITYITRI